jgi:hypothetical protein
MTNILSIEKIDPALFVEKMGRPKSGLALALREMAVGDVIAVEGSKQAAVSSQCCRIVRAEGGGRKYKTTKLDDGRIAVKRIA